MNHRTWIAICLVASLGGCERRTDVEGVFQSDDAEYVLTIGIDLSGSFQEQMGEDGRAWAFLCQIIDKYFRERVGRRDKLILAQLSNNDRALLWSGTPLELRQEFASASAFRGWLAAHADPNGSQVHAGIVQAVEYTLADSIVAEKGGKSAVFILSDMVDSSPGGSIARQRAVNALAGIGKAGGVVGLYFVDSRLCATWTQLLRDAGISTSNFRVESEIVGHPTLPSFE